MAHDLARECRPAGRSSLFRRFAAFRCDPCTGDRFGQAALDATGRDRIVLGPIVGGRLLAISQYRALAFDAATGRLLWSAAIGLPSGRGLASRGRYLLPQAAGGLAAIDVQTGVVGFPVPDQSAPLGNVVPLVDADGGAAVSQCTITSRCSPRWTDCGNRPPKICGNTLRTASRARLAQGDRESGDFENAERLYAELLQVDGPSGSLVAATSKRQTTRKITPAQKDLQPAGVCGKNAG